MHTRVYNIRTMINDLPEYNNEEEAEVAQILSITSALSRVRELQSAMAKQRSQQSLEECEDCGEEIPEQRRTAIQGVTRCVHCQGLWERRKSGY